MSTDWQRSLMTMAATFVTVVILGALYLGRSIFIPIAMAIFLAFVLSPVVSRLQRRGLGRSLSVVVTMGFVVGATLGVGAIVTQQIVHLAEKLPDRKEAIKEKVASVRQWLVGDGSSRFAQLVDDVYGVIVPKSDTPRTVAVEPSQSAVAQVDTYFSPVAELLGQTAYTFILTVFMLIRREDLRNRMIRLLGDGKVTTTTKAVDDASQRISRYLLMQLMINTCFGLVIMIGLFLIGVKYVILWGLIAAVMRYVPYVGTWIGLIPPVLYSFATASGWAQPVAVFVLFIGLEMICNNIFEPWLFGQSMGLSEVAQLVAAAFWAFMWGPIGLILSGPLTACLLVLGKHVRRFEFLEVLLGDQPALSPQVAFYQRLTARDQDEASLVALEVARQHGPDTALETVVVPALCLARRDLDDGDLDKSDFQFAVRAAREIVAEVNDLREEPAEPHNGAQVNVLVIPTRDEAEHVAADVLAATLDPARWNVHVAGDELLASELASAVEEFRPAVVVLITLPPGGLSHCRYLVGRLRARCPSVKVIVARWGSEPSIVSDQVDGIKGADAVDRSVASTRKRLAEMHPIIANESARREKVAAKRTVVGTGGA